MSSRLSRWPDIALVVILILLPLLFFWRLITPNPADRMAIAAGDFTEQYFPLRAFVAQEWVRGQIPLWNPYLYGGQPALADIQSGALYPPHVLEAFGLGWGAPLLGREVGFPIQALTWQVIAHFSLAGVGTYLFARYLFRRNRVSLRRARFGGLIASLTFTYSGYLTGFPVQQLTILEVSAWLPWVIWGLDTLFNRIETLHNHRSPNSRSIVTRILPTATSIVWSALALALAILAGHPQTVLYIVYLTLAYTLFHALWWWRRVQGVAPQVQVKPLEAVPDLLASSSPKPPHPRTTERASNSIVRQLALYLISWLLTVLLGAALAAAQLLPTLEFISRSVRADLSYQAVSAGLPLNELIAILYPGFFGGSPEYVGIASLALIALAVLLSKPRPLIYFWTGSGLVSLLLAFGGNLFVYPLFYLLAPGFDAVRQQERAFLIYSFSAAILAGYGAITLTGPLSRASRVTYLHFERRLRTIGVIAAVSTAFFIYGSTAATARGDEVNLFFGVLRHHLFGLLIFAGMILLFSLRPRRWLRRPWGMALIALWVAFNLFTVNWRFNLEKPPPDAPFAATGISNFIQSQFQTNGGAHDPARIVSGALFPGGNSAASVYNLQDLTGNTPLQLAAVEIFLQQMPAWRLWQLMNVRYIVDQRDISDPGLALIFEEGEFKLFEMGDPFDRVWFVSKTELIADEAQLMSRLAAEEFDLRHVAIVAKPLPVSLEQVSPATATVVDAGSTWLTVMVDTPGQQLLIASQIYYPGWQVDINGRRAELLRTNGILQGVVVPAGQHEVNFVYWPNTFIWGVAISTITLLMCGILLLTRSRETLH